LLPNLVLDAVEKALSKAPRVVALPPMVIR
jgi:hypothetical protein